MPKKSEDKKIQEKLRRLEAKEAHHGKVLSDVLAFSSRLTRNLDLLSLYRESNELAQKILNLDFSTLMILSDDNKSLVIRAAIGFPASMIDSFTLVEGEGLSTYVVTQKKAAIVEDFKNEMRFDVPPVVFEKGITSAISVPMMIGDKVFGVMIGHTRSKRIFSSEDIDLYQSIANQSAVAIKNVMHFQSLQDSNKRFLALLDRAGDSIFLADMNGRLVDVNKMACQVLGYSREELLRMTVFDINPQAKDMKPQENLWPKLSLDEHVTINRQHRRKDGSLFPVEIRVGLLALHDGNYILGFARDISEREQAEQERKKLEKQLIQAQKMESIGILAGGIAHDFNNILAVILGYTDMARQDAPPDSKYGSDLDKVLNAGHRAKELVKQILAFSRQTEIERIPIQLQPVIKEVLNMLRASIPSTIKIIDNIETDCRVVIADPTQVHQILMNLCTNANHAMEQSGGVLKIELKNIHIDRTNQPLALTIKPGDYVELTVSDTGSGIDPAVIDKIFDPYFTNKEPGKGTGMGLAIIHGIITGYGGAISVASKPGKGSTFHVYFPVNAQQELSLAENDQDIPQGNARLLLVDDEEILTEVHRDMLESLGYRVTVQHSSMEALTTFQNNPDAFDVVITDQTMPGMTGSDLARMLLQKRSDIPIILCTGFSNLIDEETAKSIGIKEFALKPLTRESIARLLHKVLNSD